MGKRVYSALGTSHFVEHYNYLEFKEFEETKWNLECILVFSHCLVPEDARLHFEFEGFFSSLCHQIF